MNSKLPTDRLLSFSFMLIVMISQAAGAISAENAEHRFWSWFTKNQKKLFQMDPALLPELDRRLKIVDAHLSFEFCDQIQGGKREFTISADGKSSSFPNVVKLYDSAPKLAGWRFVKFRQPHYCEELSLSSTTIHAKDVRFQLHPYKGKMGIYLYISGFRNTPNRIFERLGELFLDNFLGEYEASTTIQALDVMPLDKNTPSTARPIKELPPAFDRYIRHQTE